jgi:DNA-binding NtrC family response regulator
MNPTTTHSTTQSSPNQDKRILILEDDTSLKLLFTAILRSIDMDISFDWVSTPERATEALASPTHYDLVIADYSLSGNTTGLDVWETACRLRPGQPFLLMSVIAVDEFLKLLGNREREYPPFLPKPIDVVKCRTMISELLRRGSEAYCMAGK